MGLSAGLTYEATVTPQADSDALHRLEKNEYDRYIALAKYLAYRRKGRYGDYQETIKGIYAQLARETGAWPRQASLEQLRHGIDLLEQWLSGS